GSGSGVGGFFRNIAGSIFGRASGGEMLAGRAYLVGERGPELVRPRASGSVTPAAGLATPPIYLTVRIGDVELTQLVDVQISRREQATARAVFSGLEVAV
ncbi:MAG: hypothetical protein ACRCZP_00455, partial [Phycicoccus sp.]